MADFITFMVLKYFNNYQIPKSGNAVFALFLHTSVGKESEYLAMSMWMCYVCESHSAWNIENFGQKV